MTHKRYILRFRKTNKNIFQAIKIGKKKVETRAATEKYHTIKKGDTLRFVCGKEHFEKTVKEKRVYRTIGGMLRRYNAKEINPDCQTKEDLIEMYMSFPGYEKKIKENGIAVFDLK